MLSIQCSWRNSKYRLDIFFNHNGLHCYCSIDFSCIYSELDIVHDGTTFPDTICEWVARCCLIYPFSKQTVTCKIACPSSIFKYCYSSWVNSNAVFSWSSLLAGFISQWNSNMKIFWLIIHARFAKQYCSLAADQFCFSHCNRCWNWQAILYCAKLWFGLKKYWACWCFFGQRPFEKIYERCSPLFASPKTTNSIVIYGDPSISYMCNQLS